MLQIVSKWGKSYTNRGIQILTQEAKLVHVRTAYCKFQDYAISL
jgi:hypothetical protein